VVVANRTTDLSRFSGSRVYNVSWPRRIGAVMTVTYHALSVKQPWAALLAAGRKTIEVRRWRTNFRGRLLVHAARIPDPRPEAWAHVPPELGELARLEGGILGVGEVVACRTYSRLDAFAADQVLHLNDLSWFEPRGLFGLCFTSLRVLPFAACPATSASSRSPSTTST
jgi:hypothetical protein